ncbi:hypothetical protein [Paracoccus salsus]|uniref:hypothetical protein n=1 Tax=Paracoccus salsus TaxID=2911061 RepID=UPI001F389772|nr:hypothetical protein [Paracoccus salsus]MCF3974238.1 hypothetical protein [Paracoccus salsus]
MSRPLTDRLAAVRSAVIAGDPQKALARIEDFAEYARRIGIASQDRPRIDAALAELHVLAEASLRGAKQAADDVQAIIQAARTLQTYDNEGRRRVSATSAPAPQRF